MKGLMKKVLLGLMLGGLVVLGLAVAGRANAQSATNGAIGGSVYDAAGATVPDAEITAVNNATGQTLKAKTSASGGYRILEVTPGEYTVTVTATGYQTYKETRVIVTVGSINNVSPKLDVGSVTSVVEVTSALPELQTQGNDFATTIDQVQIDNLPINGRRWSNFALLTPGVVANSDGFGLLSFRGISFLLNNSTVDGMDNNQAYFSEERGRTRASYSISQAAVQEFQVNTSNYSAEFGRAAGGVINTVTKSGTNKLHGELFYYDRDNQWGAMNPYTQLVNQQADGSYAAVNYKPKDWRKQWGFGIGGPLIKDKLFWFYSYDQSSRNFPGTARASDPSDTFAKADATLPANYTCTGGKYSLTSGTTGTTSPGSQYACSLANALNLGNGASGYQAGAAYYAQGLQIIQSFLGQVPRHSDQVLNFPRLDWQINNTNHAIFEYNRLRYSAPAGIQTQASNFYGRASFGNDYVKTDFGVFRLVSTLSPSLINEFKFQYGRDFEYEDSQQPLPNELPLAHNRFNRPPDVQIGYYFDLAGFDIGKPYLLDRKALPDERRIQGSEGITWSHGKHTIKGGIDINRAFDRIDNLYTENGSYSYDYQWDFIADYLHATTGIGGTSYAPQYFSYQQGYGNGKMSISTTDYAGYLTDDWRISPRLTLTAGVRYEYEYVPGNPSVNKGNPYIAAALQLSDPSVLALPQTASRPDDRNNISPRVGFAWDVYGDGKTSIRGGYGMYFGRIINSNIALAYSNSGAETGQYTMSSYAPSSASNTACPLLGGDINPVTGPYVPPTGSPIAACSMQTPTVAYLSSHMQNPQVHQFDLALQQNLGWNTVFALTYMGSLGRELPSVFDTNTPGYNNSGTGTVGSATYTVCNTCAVNLGGGVALNPLPRGGKPAPLADGSKHTYKLYKGARPNPNYYNIYRVESEVNSNYHALAAQITKRYSNSLSIMSSFTWAHAMDYNPYLSTSYGSTAYLPLDPNDRRQDYGNSNLNVKHRFIFSAHYNPKFNVKGWAKWVADDWGLSPIVQIQDGLPYSAGTSGSKVNVGGNTAALAGPLGVGGAARLPKYDVYGNLENARNNYTQPGTATFDLRLSKNFRHDFFGDNVRLEVFAELFNVFNHQNITQVSNGSYIICSAAASTTTQANACPSSYPSGTSAPYLVFVPNFGQNKNSNSNTIYSPRQVQIAARLHF